MKQGSLVPALESVLAAAPVEGRSPWQDARMRFMRNKAAVASLVILVLITLACAIGPMLLPNAFDSTDWNMMSSTPTFANWHLFGTDETGRDLLVRCLIGGRVSLMIGALAHAHFGHARHRVGRDRRLRRRPRGQRDDAFCRHDVCDPVPADRDPDGHAARPRVLPRGADHYRVLVDGHGARRTRPDARDPLQGIH